MPSSFSQNLNTLAEIIIRVGLNLQRGQRLLIAEPYELQGVSRDAAGLVEAVTACAREAGARDIEVIWGDEQQYRRDAERGDIRRFEQLVSGHTDRMTEYVDRGDALLFLQSGQPELLAGVPAGRVTELHNLAWTHFGSVAQRLTRSATNWTAAPAPTPGWADAVYPDLPVNDRLPLLWSAIFEACRLSSADPLTAWQRHLEALRQQRDNLNSRRRASLHFSGDGTDITLALPLGHRWCTACLTSQAGVPFVANLPTEEVFTLPHMDSAEGRVRAARSVAYGGALIDGVELEFRGGRVIRARARVGEALLHQILQTDAGAMRLGEVAVVAPGNSIARSGRLFHLPLLDENAGNHIALGNAYAFTLRDGTGMTARQFAAAGGNQSRVHVDLPITADLV
ncbi:MAG: aminopeptidase [Opitutaceae bacterium]|nr:aminopeptidase [Opitutaceae bacterium]